MRAIVGTWARCWQIEVAEVGWETSIGAVGILAGAEEDRTRVSEAHFSEVVA